MLTNFYFKTPDKLKQEAKALSDNNDATKAAQAKIKALTAAKVKRSERAGSCGDVIVLAADLTKYISESPSSPKIKVVS